jgi:hypothetical protein
MRATSRRTSRSVLWVVVPAAIACAPQRTDTTPPPSSTTTMASAPGSTAPAEGAAAWLGRWNGVEGTYLEIARDGAGYAVTVADLDGPKTYAATAVPAGLAFTRGGRAETIRAATGRETGMKWLAEETRCLVITVGSEGFCRK